MTLPTSGPLSLNDIKGEFGGPASPSLGDYYAGGTYVPAGTSGTYGAVPTAGNPISIRNFYGTTSLVVNFNDCYVDGGYQYYTSIAGYQICGNTSGAITIGNAYTDINGTYSQFEQWVTPTSAASNYEVYATYTGNAPSGSVTSSWVSCSSNPIWYVSTTGNDSKSTTLTLQVRKVSTTTVIDTWNVYLSASSFL